MVAMPRNADSTDVWMRHYLQSLLDDPALRVPTGLLPLWLDQQVDPAERLRDNLARVTIQHVVDRSPRSVVLGPAGSGKTTLARQLVRQLAEEALAHQHALLPLYIPLTSFTGSIEGMLGAQAHMRAPAVATLALQRPCILIVDALNDVTPHEQLEVLGMLRRAMNQLGPQGRWLLLCRSEQWNLFVPWLQSPRSEVWRIRPWNDQTIQHVLQRLPSPGLKRLSAYRGCAELARRPRWLGSLVALTGAGELPGKPGQLAIEWVRRVFAEAADAHCLSDAYARMGVPLLRAIADALAQYGALSRGAIVSVTQSIADEADLAGEKLLALLDATGVLHPAGDDEWTLRSVLLADLAAALELRHESPAGWRSAIGQGHKLPLLYGLLAEPHTLIAELIRAHAWDDVQQVLDANEDADAALAVLEATHCVDIDSGAALGRVWARAGQRDVAAMLLRWAIGKGRDDPQLYGLLGDLYLAEERWAPARDAYTAALQRDPANLHYQQALARACHELGEDDVAARTLEQALSTHHRQLAETAFHLGDVYEQRKRYTEALTQYMTAASLVPSDARFGLAQARVLRLLQRFDEARSLLRSLQTLAANPAPLAHEWAELMIAQGNDQQALVHLDHLVDLDEADAAVYLKIGQIRRRQGDAAAAHQAFSMAIDLDPRCAAAYEELASLALDNDDAHIAASAYRRLAELKPDDPEVHRRLGALLRELGQLGEAAQSLLESLRLQQSADAYLELARVRWAQGEQQRALNNYRQARELRPNDGQIAAETGWALIESGEAVEAIEPLNAAALLQPNNARVLYDLGRAYEMQGRRGEALEWYERAATEAPEWVEALRATGRVAYQVGFTAMARRYLARALRCDPNDADALTEVGRLHLDARAGIRAERALRRALARGNTQPAVRRDLAQALLLNARPADALRVLEPIAEDDADVDALRSAAYEQLGDARTALLIARAAAAQRPRDPRLQRRLGSLALAAGHISEALVALETAIALGDQDPQTRIDLSRSLLRAGKTSAALRPIEWAVERAAHNAAAHEQHGLVLLALDRLDDAGEAFARAIELDPDRAAAWGGMADVWRVRHSVAAAMPYARHAIELAPDDDQHRLRMAHLLADAGDTDAAQAMLATLKQPHLEAERLLLTIATNTGQWQLAMDAAERALSAVPNDPQLLAAYGHALVRVGRPAEGVQPLVRACAAPDAPAAWWNWQGEAYVALEQWEAAARALEQSVQLDQQQPELYALLAHAYMQQDQPITAAQSLQAALEHGGERAEWRARLAEAYEALSWQPEALLEWQRAQALDPDQPYYGRQIGRLHLALGDPHAAVAEFESIAGLSGDDREMWELYARAALDAGDPDRAAYAAACALQLAPSAATPRELLGEALICRGDLDKALQCLAPLLDAGDPTPRALLLIHEAATRAPQPALARRALETAYRIAPDDADVQLRFAQHFRQSDPERAIKILRALAQREPERADIAATLAEQLLDRGDLAQARQVAERAVALASDNAAYRRLLGHICFRLGDHVAARANLQQVLTNRPQDAPTALALGKLALDRNESTEAIRLLQLAVQYAPDDPDVLGTLGLALRHSWQPVREDEPLEPQSDPALRQAINVLAQAATHAPQWRAELGWTRLIAGDIAGAISDLADAAQHLPPGSAERALALRRLALALLQAGDLDKALQAADHAAALDDGDPLIASLQGQLAELQGDRYAAVQCYSRAVTRAPGDGRFHLRLGAALLEGGEIEVALDHLEQATELEPARAQGWILLSRALMRMRQHNRALIAAQRATQLAHGDGAAWRQLADVAQALGQTDVALDAFERATLLQAEKDWFVAYADLALANGRDERGRAALQRAAHLDPEDGALAYRLSQLSQGQERLIQLERAVQLEPDNTVWRRELAELLVSRGQPQLAAGHMTHVVEREPQVAANWTALAKAFVSMGDDSAAEAALRRGLSFQPQSAALLIELATLLATRGQWREAHAFFEQAGTLQPSAAALAGQGHCLIKLGRLPEAQQALERALKLDEADTDALVDLAHIHYNLGKYTSAIGMARRALAIDPLLVDAYRTVAEAALALKHDWIQEAHEALERALAIEPEAPHLHALQSMAYFEQGAYEEALLAIRHAVRAAPDEAEYLMREAEVLQRLHRYTEAMSRLRKVVKLRKNYREAWIALMDISREMFLHGDRSQDERPDMRFGADQKPGFQPDPGLDSEGDSDADNEPRGEQS